MKKFTVGLAALATIAMLSMDTGAAKAAHGFGGFGIHIGGKNVHLDIGRPHGYHTYGNSYRASCRPPSRGVWHDTSHFDYHPGGYVRHRNHYDYVPGHFDFHRSGHWDHFGGHH